ncbi:MAG: hypothetical protein JWQ43_3429 [Glaciihabitans sp.]|nr:hypothetical protein [Glaciihabitans sp.]
MSTHENVAAMSDTVAIADVGVAPASTFASRITAIFEAIPRVLGLGATAISRTRLLLSRGPTPAL